MKSLDELYGVPRSEFVRTRNAVAARLRKAGHATDAESVAALQKPSAALWAVNHVAREHRAAIRRVIEAIDRVKRAQVGRDGDVAGATRQQRAAVSEVTRLAETALTRAGESASRQTLERVSDTVFGAAADRDARVDLEHGRLAAEWKPPGFEALLGTSPQPRRLRLVTPAAAARRRDTADEASQHARAQRAARIKAIESTVDERQRAATTAEDEVRALREQLEALQARARKERGAAKSARSQLLRMKRRRR